MLASSHCHDRVGLTGERVARVEVCFPTRHYRRLLLAQSLVELAEVAHVINRGVRRGARSSVEIQLDRRDVTWTKIRKWQQLSSLILWIVTIPVWIECGRALGCQLIVLSGRRCWLNGRMSINHRALWPPLLFGCRSALGRFNFFLCSLGQAICQSPSPGRKGKSYQDQREET